MKMIPVSSSQIAAVGYDEKSQTLRITFLRGVTYSYYPVSKEMYDALMSAESKGEYFSKNIKNNPAISFRKV